MATQILIDGGRQALDETGFAFDVRPGANPDRWKFDNTYAWPIPPLPTGERRAAPITLLPALLHPDWPNTATDEGIFARDQLSHYTQGDADTWEQYPRLHAKDWVLLSKATGAKLTSLDPIEANAGIACQFYAHGPALDSGANGNAHHRVTTYPGLVLQVQFGHTNPDKSYNLNVYESGEGYLSRGDGIAEETHLARGWLVPEQWGTIVGKWIQLFILPHNQNRILIATNTGGRGILWEDTGISRADRESPAGTTAGGAKALSSQPSLTSAHKNVTETAKAVYYAPPKIHLQPAALRYPVIGTLSPKPNPPLPSISDPAPPPPKFPSVFSLPYKPKLGEATVVEYRNGGAFAPGLTSINHDSAPVTVDPSDPTRRILQPTVTLSRRDATKTDEQRTPFHYRLEARSLPVVAAKPAGTHDLTADIIELEHSHTPDGMSGSLTVRKADTHSAYQQAFNIPFQWKVGSDLFFEAILIEPSVEWRQAEKLLHFGLAPKMRDLETVQVQSLYRFDGYTVSAAAKEILKACGYASDGSMWDIDELDAEVIAGLSSSSRGQRLASAVADEPPSNLSDVSRPAAEWLRYLRDTYTSAGSVPFQWVMGHRPYFNASSGHWEYRFYFKNPDKFSLTPVKTLYATHALAVTAGATVTTAYKSVFRHYRETAIEPECNLCIVGGVDAEGKPILVRREDKLSQKADTAIGGRPKNWLGDVRQYVLLDASLNSRDACNAACAKLSNRLFKARQQVTFEMEWEPSVRIWDTVRLVYSASEGDYHDFRITSLAPKHLQDTAPSTSFDFNTLRPAIVTAERWLV